MKLLGQAPLTSVSLEALLGLLRHVMTPSQIIHVGAGDGQGPLSAWYGWHVGSSVLIDTAPEKLAGLVDKLGSSSVQEIDAVLSNHVGEENFYELNLESESGFVSAESLKALWPGIETVEERLVATKTLDSVLLGVDVGSLVGSESDAVSLSSDAWLLIDCLPAGKVLQGAIRSLESVNLVCARVLADEVVVDAASCDEIDGVLAVAGFAQVAVLPGSHPKIGYGIFCRNMILKTKEQLDANENLVEQLVTEKNSKNELVVEVEQKNKSLAELHHSQDVARLLADQLQAELDEQRKKAQEFKVALAAVHKKVAEESDDKGKLAEQLVAEQKAKNELLTEIEQKAKAVIELQKSQADAHAKTVQLLRKYVDKALSAGLTNANKQLEAFFAIKSYFESGQMIGELHGWPISPDMGFYLILQLEKKPYDLVIEFGSGTSTQLIAKTLDLISKKIPTRPKAIQVAFEHLEGYYQKSLLLLQQSCISEKVSLQYAPLKPYVGPDGADYLYYECDDAFKFLSTQVSPIGSNILVLVDGPPESTGRYARYPAFPLLMKYFPDANIDFILDDYNRPGEKEITQKWMSQLEKMNKKYELIEIPLDKGAFKLSVDCI